MSQARKLRSGRRAPYVDGVKQTPRTKRSSRSKRPAQKLVNGPSLCFYSTFVRFSNKDITEGEYLQAILGHCNDTRHGSNRLCNNDELSGASFVESGFADNLCDVDEFTSSMANWIERNVFKNNIRILGNKIQHRLSAPYISLTSTIYTTIIFNILQAYRSDDVAAFNAGLEELDSAYEALGVSLVPNTRDLESQATK